MVSVGCMVFIKGVGNVSLFNLHIHNFVCMIFKSSSF